MHLDRLLLYGQHSQVAGHEDRAAGPDPAFLAVIAGLLKGRRGGKWRGSDLLTFNRRNRVITVSDTLRHKRREQYK